MGAPYADIPQHTQDRLVPMLRAQGIDVAGGDIDASVVCRAGWAKVRLAMVQDVDAQGTFVLFVTTDLKRFPWLFFHDTRLVNRILALAASIGGRPYGRRDAVS